MGTNLSKGLIIALVLFIAIGIIVEVDVPFKGDLLQYLEFILVTDFDLRFVNKPVDRLLASYQDFHVSTLVEGLPRVVTGW